MGKYNEYTESELIELLKQDDQQALSALYYTHVKKLKYFIQRTAQSPFLAEDIVHDTFIKIWENRLEIDSTKPFKPYLFTIAKRNLLNMLKRAQHETSIMSEIRKYSKDEENTTELQLDYNESNSLISEAINSLSGQCKEVFVRCKIQGLTYKQAAEELGITESTVNKHMNRALTLMREYIKVKNAVSVLLACIALIK
ncbi:MAG: RNA polymerase sigma-70 factor [Pedobacter sp.]|jgi:RNA polymerase sigma-70 factor (ECF subfamily)|uniref:RNA polymerase sigma factor n=1 Tax=Pedobacter sp. TaxID=1411316 RepID=UPI003562790D